MQEPDFKDTSTPLGSPFDINLTNVIWLGGAAAIMVTLLVLNMMGVIH